MLAVLGATGYTGRLVVEEGRRSGLPLRLVGRRRDALEALAEPGEEVAVADAADDGALRDAFQGCDAVASLAGPFLEVGWAPVAASIAVGAHYVDITGEQEFTRRVYDEHGPRAAERGVVLLSAFGMDYVPGDLAARLAAEPFDQVDDLAVAYSFSGGGTSRGTKRTMALLAGRPHVALEAGELVDSRFGATTRRMAFPWGEADVVEWGGTEPLTVPRHTRVRSVRSYLRAPKAAAKAAPAAAAARPVLRAAAAVGPEGPTLEERARARTAVVAVARREGDANRVALVGADPYGFTALAVVRGVEALLDGEARAAGAQAPAEAFDARTFLTRLAPLLALAD